MPNMSRRKRRSQLEITIDILDKVNTNQEDRIYNTMKELNQRGI